MLPVTVPNNVDGDTIPPVTLPIDHDFCVEPRRVVFIIFELIVQTSKMVDVVTATGTNHATKTITSQKPVS